MGALETNTTLIYGIHVRESANDGSDFTNAAADYRILFLGEDGLLHVKDSSGTVTDPYDTGGTGTGQGLIDFATAKRTSGDVTASADQVWTAVDTGIDLVLTAANGDYCELGLSMACFGTEAVAVYMTAMTVVSATLTNDIATNAAKADTTFGVQAWLIPSGRLDRSAGSILYQVVTGDISGGTVTFRLCYRTSNNTNRIIEATTDSPIHFWAKNIGPAM